MKNSQRKTNGVTFLSGGSSVFSDSKSKPIGNVQFFSSKVKIKTKVKKVILDIIEYEEYACTLHPHPNPRMLHEAIGVSIGMNSPSNGCFISCLSIHSTKEFSKIIVHFQIQIKRYINDREFSVSRRDF